MDNVLIDTDVILDFFFDRTPFSEFATEVLVLCETKAIHGYVTPVIVSNIYYLLRKTSRHKIVVEKLKQLLSILDVLKMDKNTILNALNSDFKDFEDALQNFAAIDNTSVNIILTRNEKDFKRSTLAVLSPEIYLKGK